MSKDFSVQIGSVAVRVSWLSQELLPGFGQDCIIGIVRYGRRGRKGTNVYACRPGVAGSCTAYAASPVTGLPTRFLYGNPTSRGHCAVRGKSTQEDTVDIQVRIPLVHLRRQCLRRPQKNGSPILLRHKRCIVSSYAKANALYRPLPVLVAHFYVKESSFKKSFSFTRR